MPSLKALFPVLAAALVASCSSDPRLGGGGGGIAISPSAVPAADPTNVAVLVDSGSTDIDGYVITVNRDGSATYASGAGTGHGSITTDLAAKLFDDLQASQPLDLQPIGQCNKNATFGVSVTVETGNRVSPDLTCPEDTNEQLLLDDVRTVAAALGVSERPKS